MHDAEGRDRRPRVIAEDEVLRQIELQHKPAPLTVLRHMGDACGDRLAHRGVRDLPSLERDASRPRATQADNRLDELTLPVAVDTSDPDDLAAAHPQPRSANGFEAAVVDDDQVVHLEQEVAGMWRAALHSQHDIAPHHQTREPALIGHRRGRLAGNASVTHHDDTVRREHHLVELVSDEHDGQPIVHERPQHLEKLAHLLGCEHRGWLVEDEDAGAAVEGLEDLDALLHAHREIRDAGIRVDLEAVSLGDLANPLARFREVDDPEPSGLLTEHDVLGHGEGLHEHEVLVHHADPEGDGVARRADADSLSVDEHLS